MESHVSGIEKEKIKIIIIKKHVSGQMVKREVTEEGEVRHKSFEDF